MTIKFTNRSNHIIMEAHKVVMETQASGAVEVSVYHDDGELECSHTVSDEGAFTRAYIMDAGKTIEVVKQVIFDPA